MKSLQIIADKKESELPTFIKIRLKDFIEILSIADAGTYPDFPRGLLNVIFLDGFKGWDDACNENNIKGSLEMKINEILKGDFSQCVDAANYLMMLDHYHN